MLVRLGVFTGVFLCLALMFAFLYEPLLSTIELTAQSGLNTAQTVVAVSQNDPTFAQKQTTLVDEVLANPVVQRLLWILFFSYVLLAVCVYVTASVTAYALYRIRDGKKRTLLYFYKKNVRWIIVAIIVQLVFFFINLQGVIAHAVTGKGSISFLLNSLALLLVFFFATKSYEHTRMVEKLPQSFIIFVVFICALLILDALLSLLPALSVVISALGFPILVFFYLEGMKHANS